MRSILSIAAGLSTLLTLPGVAQVPADQTSRVARVESGLVRGPIIRGRLSTPSTLEARMRELRVPAVSVAVIDSGRLVWTKAYGVLDQASARPATTDTRFQAASMSKPVAAMGALRLVEERTLALDTDVNAKLKSWKIPANDLTAKTPVTLRMLLTHTAGLTVHGFPGFPAGGIVPSAVQVLDGVPPVRTPPVRVDVAPGTLWRYSGGGMTVAQQLMSDVTGESFPALVRRLVLAPIGMKSSGYEQPLPDADTASAAWGHTTNGAAVPGRWHAYPEMMAAGLWTTAPDLARWVMEVQRAYAGKSKVLSQSMARSMLTPGLGDWGLGVAVEGAGDSLRFSHGGANAGFRGQFIGYVHGGRGVVVLTNSDAGAVVASEIIGAVATEYNWPGLSREIVALELPEAALQEYAGNYRLPTTQALLPAVVERGALWYTLSTGAKLEFVPMVRDGFIAIPGGTPIRFERDSAGKVSALVVGSTRLPRIP